jgi:hypothetical protein
MEEMWLDRVREWDKANFSDLYILSSNTKREAVILANLIRNNGYKVRIDDLDSVYSLTIERK